MLGFINKDVLSVKIISAAKQNTVQDPKLLSDFCQQMLLKEAAEPRGQEWHHGASLNPALPFTCPHSHSINVICSSVPSFKVGGHLIIRVDVSASSAWFPCVVSVRFWQVGEGWGAREQKNMEIKEHNNTFLIIYYVQSETDPHKIRENNTFGEHNNPGSLCFSNYVSSPRLLFHMHISWGTAFNSQHGFVIIYKNVLSQSFLRFMDNNRARMYYIRK